MGNIETDVLVELQAFIQTLRHSSNEEKQGLAFPMNEYMSKVQRDQSRKTLNAETADIRTGSMKYIRMRRHQAQDLQSVLRHQRAFHMPEVMTELTRNEYLTHANIHPSYTINSGDVIVHVTLPNVTNNVSPTQLEAIGHGLGRGLKNGRAGSLRDQLLMNPTTAYRSSTSY
ncbi:hypothetical protein ACIFQM_08795 [Paenibacillus sp. NRS-1782]|uniref:hypothetical protein n=1 Tax=unclassified Paenibacillus TaxID=185978 RepID=UPI003D27F965